MSTVAQPLTVEVNGRSYTVPETPIVGICLDGCEPDYLDAAATLMPNLASIVNNGIRGEARSVVPSFTNPNNVAIVTGVPSSINGIPGNFYYDAEADAEVLMNDPAWLRCPTLLATLSQAGIDVAAVTTKDKLRAFLAQGLADGAIAFSVEKAEQAARETHGIENVLEIVGRDNPGIYDPEASVFCIEAGARLMEAGMAKVLYLSTTDYVQHKWAPGEPEANEFYARLDQFLGELDRSGAIIGITADHGMNVKTLADGTPNVRYLETILVDAGIDEARVILPITDPYVVHHGALGSYATVYVDGEHIARSLEILGAIDGVEAVHTRDEAAKLFELPADRIGDLVVLADRSTVLGRTPDWHDLSNVSEGLRSHGGLHEATVPFIVNRPLNEACHDRLLAGQMRNYDLFHILCDGIADA
ncbi:MAG: phosphonoacetate hydrolase [Gemmatimonadetes bacterium]|jgi:phosphonoacetate hydrolase|nr:phosphonoacetate hydrolase [Gemmatimonadota bacterium]MBT5056010.1 phosphonoacetate hydrolase [Gemmatimonadota bacterium]MBT5143228.1 phosphonoacetate hydrolase [Gemmatimonadota bacterium]MBT5586838.1 phosphonoacetate hydrolase [Gemmatimonadota bacterium]MBT5960961.1 phosphonoacetate hydrolase [Gemmatimonadota bacterium]